MAKNSEIIGEYIITIDDNNSVSVSRIYKSTKEALRKIWEDNGKGTAPEKWTTQDLGRHILNDLCDGAKEATIGDYTIEREANNRINVLRTYKVAKEGLRDCAESIGFPYEKEWDTQNFGRRLVNYAQTLKTK